MQGDELLAKVDTTNAILSAGLLSTPIWIMVLREVSLIASTVAAICGAIIGVITVYRLIKRREKRIVKSEG